MNISDVIAQTYKDRCDIFRYEPKTTNGITRNSATLKYSNIPCALSQGNLASKETNNGVAVVSAGAKVFFTPDTDVLEGDILVITQEGSSHDRTYDAGEVFPYSGSHIEVKVTRSDPA